MKYLPICLLLTIINGCFDQQDKSEQMAKEKKKNENLNPLVTEDSLSKYSYFVVRYEGDIIQPHGTGFFLQTPEGYKFITAKHSVSRISPFDKSIVPPPIDFIGIVYTDTITNSSAFIKLDIRGLTAVLINGFFWDIPDIFVCNLIGLNINAVINPINDLLPKPSEKQKRVDKFIIHGFGFDAPLPEGTNIDSVHSTYFECQVAPPAQIDVHYPPAPGIYTTLTPQVMEGVSGAPVFIKYRDFRNNYWYEFGGIQFGRNIPLNGCYIHTLPATLNEINKASPFNYNF